MNEVRGSISRGKRHRNDEIRRGKAEQNEHKAFSLPAGKKLLEHGNAAHSVGAGFRNPAIYRERSEERHQDENQRCYRRKNSRRQEGDARLIAEGRKIIYAGEAHNTPPRVLRLRGAVNATGKGKIGE